MNRFSSISLVVKDSCSENCNNYFIFVMLQGDRGVPGVRGLQGIEGQQVSLKLFFQQRLMYISLGVIIALRGN